MKRSLDKEKINLARYPLTRLKIKHLDEQTRTASGMADD
jgi:hypothetical protein